MSKWIICILISNFAGSLTYILWLLLQRVTKKHRDIILLYHTLRTVTVMFAVLVLGGILWAVYMQLFPTNTLWPIEPTYLRLFLYLLSATWIIGAVYKLADYTREYILLTQRIKDLKVNHGFEYEILQQTAQEMNIQRVPTLLTGCDVATPELFGLFKQVIILPEEFLLDSELKHIFLHELYHLKFHDRLIRELAVLAHCIHWFNPLLTRILDDLERIDELHCDACVCDEESADKRIYATVLYMLGQRAVKHNRHILNVTFVEKGGNLLERMKFIEIFKKGSGSKKWLTVMLATVFVVCSTTVALGATEGMVHLYDDTVQANLVGVEETMQADEMIEYREYVGSWGDTELAATDGEITPNASSTDFFDVDLTGNWNTGEFYASSGQEIVLQVIMDPADVNIKIGIYEPDGWSRYLYNCGDISHTFKLTKTGRYAIFMINETGQTVRVRGSYYTRTPN